MDAWIAYHATDYLTISVGQKQTFVNNKEMMIREKHKILSAKDGRIIISIKV